jgi:hypothetical protein
LKTSGRQSRCGRQPRQASADNNDSVGHLNPTQTNGQGLHYQSELTPMA